MRMRSAKGKQVPRPLVTTPVYSRSASASSTPVAGVTGLPFPKRTGFRPIIDPIKSDQPFGLAAAPPSPPKERSSGYWLSGRFVPVDVNGRPSMESQDGTVSSQQVTEDGDFTTTATDAGTDNTAITVPTPRSFTFGPGGGNIPFNIFGRQVELSASRSQLSLDKLNSEYSQVQDDDDDDVTGNLQFYSCMESIDDGDHDDTIDMGPEDVDEHELDSVYSTFAGMTFGPSKRLDHLHDDPLSDSESLPDPMMLALRPAPRPL